MCECVSAWLVCKYVLFFYFCLGDGIKYVLCLHVIVNAKIGRLMSCITNVPAAELLELSEWVIWTALRRIGIFYKRQSSRNYPPVNQGTVAYHGG